jgi:hypothetical protein
VISVLAFVEFVVGLDAFRVNITLLILCMKTAIMVQLSTGLVDYRVPSASSVTYLTYGPDTSDRSIEQYSLTEANQYFITRLALL